MVLWFDSLNTHVFVRKVGETPLQTQPVWSMWMSVAAKFPTVLLTHLCPALTYLGHFTAELALQVTVIVSIFFWDLQIFQNRSWSLEYCPCSRRKIFVRGIRLGGIGVTNTDTRWVSSIPALGGDFVSILSFQFIGDVSSSKSFFSAVRRSPHYETCQKR